MDFLLSTFNFELFSMNRSHVNGGIIAAWRGGDEGDGLLGIAGERDEGFPRAGRRDGHEVIGCGEAVRLAVTVAIEPKVVGCVRGRGGKNHITARPNG